MFLLKEFPKISETFIVNEIIALINMGHDITIFSFKKSKNIVHDIVGKYQSSIRVFYLTDLMDDEGYSKLFKQCASKIRRLMENGILTGKELARFWERINGSGQGDMNKLRHMFSLSAILEVVKKHQIQHIHSHFADYHLEFAYLVYQIARVPYTVTMHGYDIFFNPPGDLIKWTSKAKKIITVSRYNRNYMAQKLHLNLNKIRVIPCGINLSLFRKLVVAKEKEFIVLSVGRFHPVKGHAFLIEAVKLLAGEGMNFKCWIIGEGPEKQQLEKQIAKCGIERYVRLLEAMRNEELPYYYSKADVFVLASISEGSPMVLKESLACETPVIASKVNGIQEIVRHYGNGILVRSQSPSQIAVKIRELIINPSLIRNFKKNARASIEKKFDIRKNVKRLERLFKE